MGYENENAAPVLVDIETIPLPIEELEAYLDGLNFKAPANYKDPEKIAQAIAEQKAAAMAEAGLDLDLCRVCAIGIAAPWTPEPYKPFALMARAPKDEPIILSTLWKAITNRGGGTRPLMTYNGRSFDLPILMRRSRYCHVPAPRLNVNRFRSNQPDIMVELSYDDIKKVKPLRFYVRRLRIQVEEHPEAAQVSGKDIARLAAENTDASWALIEGHVVRDVAESLAVARYFDLLPSPITVAVGSLPL